MNNKEKSVNKKKNLSKKTTKKPVESFVEFTFYAPDAKDVYLAGDFNDWDIHSHPMEKINGKDWKITIKLTPGYHEYKYFMDGRWVEDIPGVKKVSNSFGTQNFVIHNE